MTYQQGLRLVTRAITVYLLTWAISDLIGIPREIQSVARETHNVNLGATPDAGYYVYLLRQAILWLSASVLRATIWIMLALWFYRCGPTLQRFFAVEPFNENETQTTREP